MSYVRLVLGLDADEVEEFVIQYQVDDDVAVSMVQIISSLLC